MKIVGKTSDYHRFNTLVYRCDFHVIWCTKYRRPVLIEDISTRLKELVFEKETEYGYQVHELEVMPDHVHLLAGFTPKQAPNRIIGRIKGYTSHVSCITYYVRNFHHCEADCPACGRGANSLRPPAV